MLSFTILCGLMGLLIILFWGHCLDERKRILKGKTEFIRAKLQDFGDCYQVKPSEKQKPANDLSHWMDEVQEIVKKSECLLGGQQVGGWWSLVTSLKMRWGIDTLVDALEVLDKKGDDVLSRHVMSYARGLFRGNLLPVEAVVGQVASNTLVKLEYLLQNDKVGRIAIHGVEGVGKTFLMKHLHNSAVRWVDRFDHVFWITFPDQFTIKNVQSAVAAAVNCDLASDDDLNVRARKLSDKLASFVSFALFLDGVPEVVGSISTDQS
ncbi:probable disease resistance protein At5g63020 isoform X2 [Chenopodium quinoa]|uniref:probable disease resistance protein At5g63020 isoform X2 n=1 Tax=Chenopodium quinoa TaxID=63459 RepID=UPI000B78E790|nr:probable disease resistance protein At5g63020 isoform X2 [Chenopodium quinoa]